MRLVTACVLLVASALVGACAEDEGADVGGPPGPGDPAPTIWDVDSLGVPKFVATDYIELARIAKISKFRSGEGHDYSDAFETCRSMKHYYVPAVMAEADQIPIFAPVNGTVSRLIDEWAGTQVQIRPSDYPAFSLILFHVNLFSPLTEGQPLTEGEPLGTHIGAQTHSDVAVGVTTPTGYKLVSWFDVMTDALFQSYGARGIAARAELVIPRAARDAAPLVCDSVGGPFANTGTLENWVPLQ